MSTITERVERGAALLDERRPGWWRDIDMGTLDIRSPCRCILGQMGSLLRDDGSLSRFGTGLDMVKLQVFQSAEFGFDWSGSGGAYATWDEINRLMDAEDAALTAAWRDLIGSRRAAAEAVSC